MAQLSEDVFAYGKNLRSVDEALALMTERLRPLAGAETRPLALADGHVLAEDVHAAVGLPPFDNSAVDGDAARSIDLAANAPTQLRLSGRIAAGRPAPDTLMADCVVRVLTGAPTPPGADIVFMQEDLTVTDDGYVSLPSDLKVGANLRRAGEDVLAGAVALPAPTHLR